MLSSVGGQIADGLTRTTDTVAVGSSGAICGIIGAVLADSIKNYELLNQPRIQVGYWTFQLCFFC